MPLADLNLPPGTAAIPGDVRSFLCEADRRIERFRRDSPIHGFVPCDFAGAYGVLQGLEAANLASGSLLCEWGSGFGVVACLAAMLGFDACGIEVEGELVDAARRLADDFGLPVEFVRGSFIPRHGEILVHDAEFAWLTTDADDGPEELGLGPDDFDIIFAYPWPDEERVTARLFERVAAVGTLLVTYHGGDDFRLRRKIGRRARIARTGPR